MPRVQLWGPWQYRLAVWFSISFCELSFGDIVCIGLVISCDGIVLAVSFGSIVWQRRLVISFGDIVWHYRLAMSLGKIVWQYRLAVSLRNIVGQYRWTVSFSNVAWHDRCGNIVWQYRLTILFDIGFMHQTIWIGTAAVQACFPPPVVYVDIFVTAFH